MDLQLKADILNGMFEIGGGIAIIISIMKLYKDKIVRGVSWLHVAFFSLWGLWNIIFYPIYGAWFSFAGGVFLLTTNVTYTTMLIYYTVKEKNETRTEDSEAHFI
jgi:uncharacterized membrane protein YfcA